MDDLGFRARRRAAASEVQYRSPRRDSDGRYTPVESAPAPFDDYFIGGFDPNRPLVAALQAECDVETPLPQPTHRQEWQWEPEAYSPGPSAVLLNDDSPSHVIGLSLPKPTAHLQVMCGPLLRYDTVDAQKVWHGAVLLVTADAGSTYDPHPMVTVEFDPDRPSLPHTGALDAGTRGPRAQKVIVPGQEIFQYRGMDGTYTFWRFLIEVPLGPQEMNVQYNINRAAKLGFFVPGANQNMRWAAHSCNGFSIGVPEANFTGPGFTNGYDPVWTDLLDKHAETPFHVLVGGGDQLYCDRLTHEPEMQGWLTTKNASAKLGHPLSEEMRLAMDRFYFNHYCRHFRRGAFAEANRSIPMLNMLDDHDVIDGWGSYPADLQSSPVFNAIGSRGYFWFLLFQLFTVDEIDGTVPVPGNHTFKSTIIGGDGVYVPYPNHSVLSYLGPQVYMLLLDGRSERRKNQVSSQMTYDRVFAEIRTLPSNVEHLVILLGIPIAYPRLNFLEKSLDSKLNPLLFLGKSGLLSGFVNKFNSDAELLDDLNDHWTAAEHKQERNWFVDQCQRLAMSQRLRVSFVSGDVHCAAVGAFMTLRRGSRLISPSQAERDHRYMLNVVTSAIVNTPPPLTVLKMVNMLSDKKHKTMHDTETDETMLPLFAKNPDGTPSNMKYIYGARNWTRVTWDERTGELEFDIRIEKERGRGVTVGYPVRAPRPLWEASTGFR